MRAGYFWVKYDESLVLLWPSIWCLKWPPIFQVLSLTLDKWSDDEIDFMVEVGGNSYANAIYEAFLPREYAKPRPDSSIDERTKFIR